MRKLNVISPRAVLLVFCLIVFAGTCCCRNKPYQFSPGDAQPPEETKVQTITPSGSPLGPEVRVAVLKDAALVRLRVGKSGRALNTAGGIIQQLPQGVLLEMRPYADGFTINGAPFPNDKIIIFESSGRGDLFRLATQTSRPRALLESSGAAELFHLEDQEVAERLSVMRSAAGTGLTVVAHLNLEDYLIGVLAGEVPFQKWHAEALKAQAVASRSFALYQLKKNTGENYDLESTEMSQVFRPGFQGNPILRAAVEATRGLVLTDHGKLFPAYFCSTCGGRTAEASTVFPDQPPIRALSPVTCRFCDNSPYYRWTWTLRKDTMSTNWQFWKDPLAERLRTYTDAPKPPVKIDRVEFLDAKGAPVGVQPDTWARVSQVRIHHSLGTLMLPGNQFRLAVGPRDLKSLYFDRITDTGNAIEFSGGGFGHGVGLCQYGAEGMAAGGYTYPAILGIYYTGAALAKMY